MDKITITPCANARKEKSFFVSINFAPLIIFLGIFITSNSNLEFYKENVVVIICAFVVLQLFFSIGSMFMILPYSTSMTFDMIGMEVRCWKYKRNYKWTELKVRKITKNTNSMLVGYTEGAVFSTEEVHSSRFMSEPVRYRHLNFFHPFDPPFFVDFEEKDPFMKKNPKTTKIYQVNKERFLTDLKSLGVEIDQG